MIDGPIGDGSVHVGDESSVGDITTIVNHGFSAEELQAILRSEREELVRIQTEERRADGAKNETQEQIIAELEQKVAGLEKFQKSSQDGKINGSRAIYTLILEKALNEKKAQEFEDFFASIGNALWAGKFDPWKPQGIFGDYKCDGYLTSERTVFQCNAPEKFVAATVTNKIEGDFLGAVDHFEESMQKWVFVHNQDQGLPATAGAKLIELRTEFPEMIIEAWGPAELMRRLKGLDISSLTHFLGSLEANFEFDQTTLDTIEPFFRNKKIRTIVPPAAIEPTDGQNIDELNEVLENLGAEDGEVRRRILGYSLWYDPAEKNVIFEKLGGLGYEQAIVELNALRLADEGVLTISQNHYLPNDLEICQQAADTLSNEFMAELGAM